MSASASGDNHGRSTRTSVINWSPARDAAKAAWRQASNGLLSETTIASERVSGHRVPDTSVAKVAKDLGISESCLRR